MHDGMQYEPIQGQGQGHEPFKVGNPVIFKSYLLRHLQRELATDHGFLNYGTTISKFDRAWFLANVNYVTFAIMLSQIRLSVVCNVGAPYSAGWNFRQFFFAIR